MSYWHSFRCFTLRFYDLLPLEAALISRCFYYSVAVGFMALVLLSPGVSQSAESMLRGAHANTEIMPKSCRACHRGMRISVNGEEDNCLKCHGDPSFRSNMASHGYLANAGVSLADISLELLKPYSHPTLSYRDIHRQNELLPEDQMQLPRHSECVDCHNPHAVSADQPYRGIPGRRVGDAIVDVQYEYELCYKCHAESANLPGNSTNKHAEFNISNPSFHPIEGEGASAFVISLKEPYVARADKPADISVITCSSCHGSEDANGPKGPHGSTYEGLLVENYEQRDGFPEGQFTYALCYRCHERNSILADESFPHHSRHIVGLASAAGGTSCFTCHDAHGSTQYPSLIRFNEEVVRPNLNGKLEYRPNGVAARSGTCSLLCHEVEHDDRSY